MKKLKRVKKYEPIAWLKPGLCVMGVFCVMKMKLFGNVVISKKFLRTRKIMVMHRNERGECCLRTLVDRSGSVDAT